MSEQGVQNNHHEGNIFNAVIVFISLIIPVMIINTFLSDHVLGTETTNTELYNTIPEN
jgi:dipeptide/tripeptide permease